MTFAIDAILIFTAVFCIWSGTRKGFVRSVMGLVTSVVSAVAAYAFTPQLAQTIREKFLLDPMTEGIEGILRSFARDTTTDLFNLDRLAEELPETFTSMLERYHVEVGDITSQMTGITMASDQTVHDLATRIADPTVNVLASSIAFIVLFFGIFLALTILTSLLDLAFRMPVLSSANMFFGFVFGVVEAVVFVSVLAIVLSVLVRGLGAVDPTLFGDEVVDNTIVCSFILEHNPFDKIYEVLQ